MLELDTNNDYIWYLQTFLRSVFPAVHTFQGLRACFRFYQRATGIFFFRHKIVFRDTKTNVYTHS